MARRPLDLVVLVAALGALLLAWGHAFARTADDPARHKETAHYAAWRDTVADMMAAPRTSVKYANVFPGEGGWDMVQA